MKHAGRKIVVVENEKEIALLVSHHLAMYGLKSVALYKTSEIKSFRSGKIHADADFVICDIMMPWEGLYTKSETANGAYTGLRLAMDLRKRYLKIPILFWSAFPVKEVREMAKRVSANVPLTALLEKPKGISELTKIIYHFFDTGRFKVSLAKRIWNSLQLRPGVAGFGVDLKELTKR